MCVSRWVLPFLVVICLALSLGAGCSDDAKSSAFDRDADSEDAFGQDDTQLAAGIGDDRAAARQLLNAS